MCACVWECVDGLVLYMDDWSAVSPLCQEHCGIPRVRRSFRKHTTSGNWTQRFGSIERPPSFTPLLFLLFPPSVYFGSVFVPDLPHSSLLLQSHSISKRPNLSNKEMASMKKMLHYVNL